MRKNGFMKSVKRFGFKLRRKCWRVVRRWKWLPKSWRRELRNVLRVSSAAGGSRSRVGGRGGVPHDDPRGQTAMSRGNGVARTDSKVVPQRSGDRRQSAVLQVSPVSNGCYSGLSFFNSLRK
jgi:hypothetical protein